MQRLEREAEERARQRRLKEHQEIQKKAAKEKLEQLKSTAIGFKVFADMDVDVSYFLSVCFTPNSSFYTIYIDIYILEILG